MSNSDLTCTYPRRDLKKCKKGEFFGLHELMNQVGYHPNGFRLNQLPQTGLSGGPQPFDVRIGQLILRAFVRGGLQHLLVA